MSYKVYTPLEPGSKENILFGEYEDEGIARGQCELLLQNSGASSTIETEIPGGSMVVATYAPPEPDPIPEPETPVSDPVPDPV